MMNDLPKKVMENGIHYTLMGDYYFPTCTLQDTTPTIGRWADMYERYLQEEHPSEYTRLIWSNELIGLLQSVQEDCESRLAVMMRQMADAEGMTESIKAENQLEWVRCMNSIRSRAEEIIIAELRV